MNRISRREVVIGGAVFGAAILSGRKSPSLAETRRSSEIPDRFTALGMYPSGDRLVGMVEYGGSQHIVQSRFSAQGSSLLQTVVELPFQAQTFAASRSDPNFLIAGGSKLFVKRSQQQGEVINHHGGEVELSAISPDNAYAFYVRRDTAGKQHLGRLDLKAATLVPHDISIPTAESLGFSSMSKVMYNETQGSYTFYAGDGDPRNGFMRITHIPATNRSQVQQIQIGSLEALSIHPRQNGSSTNEVWVVSRSRRIVRVENDQYAGQIEPAYEKYSKPNDPQDPTLRAITEPRITINTLSFDKTSENAFIGTVQTVYYFDSNNRLTARHTPLIEALSVSDWLNPQKRIVSHRKGVFPRFGVTWDIGVVETAGRKFLIIDNLHTESNGLPGMYDGFYASDITDGVERAGDWVRVSPRVKAFVPLTHSLAK